MKVKEALKFSVILFGILNLITLGSSPTLPRWARLLTLLGSNSHGVKEARKAELMQLQAGISLAKLKKLQGKTMDMLVEGVNPEERLLVGRTYRDAPEIDGLAIAVGEAHEGELVSIQVTNTTEYDMIGEQRKT